MQSSWSLSWRSFFGGLIDTLGIIIGLFSVLDRHFTSFGVLKNLEGYSLFNYE